MGLPFIAVRGLVGSDILKYRPDLKVMGDPFHSGEEAVVAEPIRPDIAVFHAIQADRWGNSITPGLREDLMLARAARCVVVTAEKITDHKLTLHESVGNTFLPAIDVDAVAHAPIGAHPLGFGTLYPVDTVHIKEYISAAQGEDSFKAYLDKYVYSVGGEQEYLKRVGIPA